MRATSDALLVIASALVLGGVLVHEANVVVAGMGTFGLFVVVDLWRWGTTPPADPRPSPAETAERLLRELEEEVA